VGSGGEGLAAAFPKTLPPLSALGAVLLRSVLIPRHDKILRTPLPGYTYAKLR